jgi:hypothetical protein
MTPILLSDVSFVNALVLLAGVAILSFAALKGWRDWIAFKREELAQAQGTGHGGDLALPHAASRIELADLKERLRKLEAIAAGVDL